MDVSAWSGWDWAKVIFCGLIDFFDFTVGRVLFFFPFEEVGYMIATCLMWGWRGIVTLFEVVDITEQLDGFLPVSLGTAIWSLHHKHG